MKKERIPFDKLWKDVVGANISDFLEMFLPELHVLVDYNVKIEFLEQELKSALKDKTLKIVDKLIGLQLKDGTKKWVYVHVEFETKPPGSIAERMFEYYLRIREAFSKELTAIVIYTGSDVPVAFDKYTHTTFGTTITYQFNAYNIRDQKEEELRNNPNPFAVIVLANLYVLQTKNDPEKRLTLKEHIYEIARQRNYSEEKINSLLSFVFELMLLPKAFENRFNEFINTPTKSTNMAYITHRTRDSVDAMAKGAFGKTFTEVDLTIVNTIVHLYSKMQLSIETIAEITGLDVKEVHSTLKKQKLIKK